MTTSELMTIGAFARATGLTPGALRFYADSSLLEPARIDETTGYRYYAPGQLEQAEVIRSLRQIDMPLDMIESVLAGDASPIDRHVSTLTDQARLAARSATAVHATLDTESRKPMFTVNGPVLAAALDQTLTATSHHPEHPVLAGVYLEWRDDTLTMTTTDRFRLVSRSLVAKAVATEPEWTAVVDGDDLRSAVQSIRQHHRVQVDRTPSAVTFRPGDDRARILAAEFPDYRAMLGALPDVTTRMVVAKSTLLSMLDTENEYIDFTTSDMDATVSGPDVDMAFAVTTLYPAVVAALGPDVMIDVSGPEYPVVIRSADSGDLTTLAMPVDRKLLLSRS